MWARAQDDPPQPGRGVLGGNTIPRMAPDLPQSCFYWSHGDFTAGVVFSADGLYGGFILLMCNTAQKKKPSALHQACGWSNISSVPITVTPFFFPPVLSVSTTHRPAQVVVS